METQRFNKAADLCQCAFQRDAFAEDGTNGF